MRGLDSHPTRALLALTARREDIRRRQARTSWQPLSGHKLLFQQEEPCLCQKVWEASADMLSSFRVSKDHEGRLKVPAVGSEVSPPPGGQPRTQPPAMSPSGVCCALGQLSGVIVMLSLAPWELPSLWVALNICGLSTFLAAQPRGSPY